MNNTSCIPKLIELLFFFQSLVKTYNINESKYCLKYYKGCLIASSNRLAYLGARYIHQQVQQNSAGFNQQIPDLLNFLSELDTAPYLFACFRQFLGLRTLSYFPEKFISDSELMNQIGIIFTIDEKNVLGQMYSDLQESASVTSDFKSGEDFGFVFRVMLISVEQWPSYPQFRLRVGDEVDAARRDFESFYRAKFGNRKVAWQDSLETCVFAYQGCSITCHTAQYVALRFLKDGKDLCDAGIPKEQQGEVVSSLVRAGLLVRRNGKLAFQKLRQAKKTMRINTLTMNYPGRLEEKDDSAIFISERKKISTNIMIALKKKNDLKYEKLYRKTQELLDFPLAEKSFKNCVSSLLAQQMIVKCNDNVYRYFPI